MYEKIILTNSIICGFAILNLISCIKENKNVTKYISVAILTDKEKKIFDMESAVAIPYVKSEYLEGEEFSIKVYDKNNKLLVEKSLSFKEGFAYMEDYCLKNNSSDDDTTKNCIKNSYYITYGFEYIDGAFKSVFYKGKDKLAEAMIQHKN